jgi:hypothetical protein
VTPWGVDMPLAYKILYDRALPAFGRARTLVCPHLSNDGRKCGIWRWRNGTCATWFCTHLRGETGARFWRHAKTFFSVLEDELAASCFLALGLGAEAIAETMRLVVARKERDEANLSAYTADGRAEPSSYARAWGAWKGRERELYERCFRMVKQLSWTSVLSRCGPRLRAHSRVVAHAHAELLSNALPKRVRLGSLFVEAIPGEPGLSAVTARGSRRTVECDARLLLALRCFRGQPLREALREIVSAHNLSFEDAQLRALVDVGVLEPA